MAHSFKCSHYLVACPLADIQINKVVLFATRTARTLTVSEALYDKLKREAWDEMHDNDFEKLLRVEAIVPAGEDELQTVLGRNNAAISDKKSLYHVIQPTAMCQLGCGYCGQKHTKDYLSTPVSSRIVERIESKFARKDYNHVEIAWFGGEPLMGYSQIRELTPQLQQMAARHNCTYGAKLVTNGLSLKEPIFLELVKKHGIKKIEVTLDGTAEYHDARRHTKEGISTFDLIFNNILKICNRPDFKELGCSITLRCNVDERNHAGVVPLIKLLAEHNLQDKLSYFYVAPIHSWGNEAHLRSLEKQEFANREISWLVEQFRHGFKPTLVPTVNPIVCLSVTPDAEVFDAFGNVFDCSEVPYVETYEGTDYLLGNMKNGMPASFKPRSLNNFNDQVAEGEYPCTGCEMLPVCGGGCPKSWREGVAPCPPNKFNIKDKLALYYLQSKRDEKFQALINN